MVSRERTLRRNLLLGQVALRMQQLEEEELQDALSIQETLQEDGIKVPLGKICTDKGYLTASALEHLLAAQRLGKRTRRDTFFGNVALSNHLLDRAALKKVLLLQRRYEAARGTQAPRVGQILVQQERMTVFGVRAILRAQKRLRAVGEGPMSGQWRQLLWYIATPGERLGPLTDRELTARLRDGQIGEDDLVWRSGFDDWQLVGELDDYADRLPAGVPS